MELYEPIQSDLAGVRELLNAELTGEEPFVRDLMGRLSRQSGKLLRPALVLLSGRAFAPCTPRHHTLAAIVEMVHLASLVHDDVLDEALARRSVPSINRLVGNEGAVLLGDYIMAKAFRLCSSLRSHEVNEELTETCRMICLGELVQVSQRHNLRLTEGEYLHIITRKTAWLLRSCCLLGARLSGVEDSAMARMGEYGLNLGIAFQIADDLLDLQGTEEEMGKSLGRDIAKGDLTLPLIRFLNTASGEPHRSMVAALSEPTPDSPDIVRRLLINSDCLETCLQLAREYGGLARICLEELPASPARDALFALTDFVASRRS